VEPIQNLSPALAPLWLALHTRLSSGRPVSRVRLGPLDVPQQEALADLLGLARLPGEQPSVSLSDIEAALGAGVRDVVSRLVGPIGDRAGDQERARAERTDLWDWVAHHPVVLAQPALADWAAALRRGGLIGGSVPCTRDVVGRALAVLAQLPAAGMPLPVFADTVLGDPHALDEDSRCAGLVLRALALIYDLAPPADAVQRRALWERAGIADDELSSTVLAAGLRTVGDGVVNRVLRLCAEAGQATALTLQQLRKADLTGSGIDEVWVVENPSLLALALARFGADAPPLVCTSGWPSSAGILLLQRLCSAGALLRYHGDFDGEGLRIAANVVARTGARPWRMSSGDYLDAVADGPPVGRVTPVPWDDELAGHLIRVGRSVPEERVATALLDEIAPGHAA
jgi:uncharacterized protein (TIGR02679 family)